MTSIPKILSNLRKSMETHGVDAYLVPSFDEHLNEYLLPHRKRREFASGFTGSAGDLLVLKNGAFLYTDGRYHLQAEAELLDTGITLMPVGRKEAKVLTVHVAELAAAAPGFVLGVDPRVLPLALEETLDVQLSRAHGSIKRLPSNLVDPLWESRPEPTKGLLLELEEALTGATFETKLNDLLSDIVAQDASSFVTVKLDQIAWLLNLRSRDDVPYNPVFESFLVIDEARAHLFLRSPTQRLPSGFRDRHPDLQVHEWSTFESYLATLRGTVLIDPDGVTAGVTSVLTAAGCTLRRALSPIEVRKAIKNAAEIEAMERANLHASVAKTRALLWLNEELREGRTVTEIGFRRHLEKLYSDLPDFHGLSFNTIAGTGEHGAIIHYGSCDETPLLQSELFLIDSGIHLGGGTTDDTRTVSTGIPTEAQRHVYTTVLKGHINAARHPVPDGVSGSALDALARAPLWEQGLHYDHGTGHGVGAYLNVHEGPFAIAERERRQNSSHPLRAGMVTSIEPGFYKSGFGGIRLENLYVLERHSVSESPRDWLRLKPLTYIPFERRLIQWERLTTLEREWLQAYHDECEKRLNPHLSEDEGMALRKILAPIDPP
jgi:Xaa-Pro aminopeptidase